MQKGDLSLGFMSKMELTFSEEMTKERETQRERVNRTKVSSF